MPCRRVLAAEDQHVDRLALLAREVRREPGAHARAQDPIGELLLLRPQRGPEDVQRVAVRVAVALLEHGHARKIGRGGRELARRQGEAQHTDGEQRQEQHPAGPTDSEAQAHRAFDSTSGRRRARELAVVLEERRARGEELARGEQELEFLRGVDRSACAPPARRC
jgi:hypothetical protein